MSGNLMLLLSQVGLGAKYISIASVAIGLIAMIFKTQPLTLLTSTKIEKVYFSKEKNFLVGMGNIIVLSNVAFLFSILLTWVFFILEVDGGFLNISFIIYVLALIMSGYFTFLKKKGCEKERRNRILSFASLFIAFLQLYSIFPVTLSDALKKEELFLDNAKQNIYLILFLCLGMFIVNTVFTIFSKGIFEHYRSIWRDYSKEVFYIINEDSKKRWYIYHLIDRNNMLLGDSIDIKKAAIFKILSKEELFKQEVFTYRIPKKQVVEYSI